MKNKKMLLLVLVAALLAAGAGLWFTKSGEEEHVEPIAPPPVTLTEPFIIPLADEGDMKYAKLSVAVEVAPLNPEDYHHFTVGAGGGGHGGATETPATKLAVDPILRDAVITATSTFTSDDLRTNKGKDLLREAILSKYAESVHAHGEKETDKKHPKPEGWRLREVYFTNFAVG